jgi:hypothetical protein
VASTESGQWVLTLSGLRARDPGIFLLAVEHVRAGGALPLPLDLGGLGMKGCTLNVDMFEAVASLADSSGVVRFRLPVPSLSSFPIVLHAQGIELDPTKAVGLATSNAAHSILSERHLSTYLFNWSRDGKQAEYGPFSSNRAAVLLFKP